MYHLQSEKIVRMLWNYEDHWYILKKRRGPRTDPWGTPYWKFGISKSNPFIVTNCFLLERQEENQQLAISLIPKFIKQYFMIYSIKSFANQQRLHKQSIAFSIFSIRLITASAVEKLFWNPNCFLYRTFWLFKNPISLLCIRFSITLSRFDDRVIGL